MPDPPDNATLDHTRALETPMPAVYRFHGFTLDTAAGALAGPLGAVSLRPKAMALLELFVRGAGRALGKDEIMQTVWAGVTVTKP